jgi:hypothetical protein
VIPAWWRTWGNARHIPLPASLFSRQKLATDPRRGPDWYQSFEMDPIPGPGWYVKKVVPDQDKCPHRLWHLWKKWSAMGEVGVILFNVAMTPISPHLLCRGVALSAPEQSPDWLYRNFDRGQLFHWNSSNIVASWKVNLTRSYSQSYGGSSFNT